jgi:hypothetical protein
METKVTKWAFKYGGMKFFRGEAYRVRIGTYGEKKDPLGPKAYLDVESHVKLSYLKNIGKMGPVEVDWARQSKADVATDGDVKYLAVTGKVAGSFNYENAKSAKLKLMSFYIEEGTLKQILNGPADGARSFLAKEGGDGRIVSQIFVAMEAQLAETFSTAGSLSSEAEGDVLAVTAKGGVSASGGAHGSSTIILAPNTTFAYKLMKVKDWDHGKNKIEDLEADYKGGG